MHELGDRRQETGDRRQERHLPKTTQRSHPSATTVTAFPLKLLPENPVKEQPARTPTTSMSFLVAGLLTEVVCAPPACI
jgi:hypothetical protein